MISFIVIGRNESKYLAKCFESIQYTIRSNNLTDFEVIYVDSDSTDDSLKIALSFASVRVYKISGVINAAIGRNVGVSASFGDVLFFIDGDMEIIPEFLPLVYSEETGLKYDFVSGKFTDLNYDNEGKLVSKFTHYPNIQNETRVITVGGLFLIKKVFWEKMKGMKNKLRRSQDIDFAIRLATKGIFLVRRPEILALHHTVPYNDNRRSWKLILNGSECFRSVLLRDNFLSPIQWKYFVRNNYSSIYLLLILVLTILTNNLFLGSSYFVLPVVRASKKNNQNILQFVNTILYYITRDCMTWIAFITFFPSNKSNFNISVVRE